MRYITIHHFSSLAQPSAAPSHPTFRHDTLFFGPERPLGAPGPPRQRFAIPLNLKAIASTPPAPDRSPAAPAERDTFRHFATLSDTSVEFCRIAHSGPCFRLIFALDMGCILKMAKGLLESGLFRKHLVSY